MPPGSGIIPPYHGDNSTADGSPQLRDNSTADGPPNEPFAGGYIVRAHADPPALEALQLGIRYTNYLDCSRIDEPGRPRFEPDRAAAAQARLRPALREAITAFAEHTRVISGER